MAVTPNRWDLDFNFVRREQFTRAEYEQAAPFDPVGEVLYCEVTLTLDGRGVADAGGASVRDAVRQVLAALSGAGLPKTITAAGEDWLMEVLRQAEEERRATGR